MSNTPMLYDSGGCSEGRLSVLSSCDLPDNRIAKPGGLKGLQGDIAYQAQMIPTRFYLFRST